MKRVTISVLDKEVNTVVTIEAAVDDSGKPGDATWNTPDGEKYPNLKALAEEEARKALDHAAKYCELVLMPTKFKKKPGETKCK